MASLVTTDLLKYEAAILRESLEKFVRTFWEEVPGAGTVKWNWHMTVLCNELQIAALRVFRGEPREYDLVFNVPFGTSKSTICSILFPAWMWTFMSGCRFLVATHTDKLVMDLASKSRAVIVSEKYRAMFGVELSRNQDTKEYFTNTAGGDRNSCTVGGKTPTGFHGHIIIVDDPIDPQGARSEAELENAEKFMTDVISSRKVDKAVTLTVLVMQRVHFRDPTAVMVKGAEKEGAAEVRRVCLPGELTDKVYPPELKDKYIDGLMDPVRLNQLMLNEYKARGQLFYATQVLQEPYPPGGGMFKIQYFSHRVKAAPYNAVRVRSWDRAATEGGGCWTVGTLMARPPEGDFFVEHVTRGQWEPTERDEIILAIARRDRARYGPRYEPTIYIEHEPGSSGVDAFKHTARKLAGFKVRPYRPTGKKDVRAEPWSAQLAAGNVFIVDNGEHENAGKADWDINAFVEEHCSFVPMPGKRIGGICDQVDSAASAFSMLLKRPFSASIRVLPRGVGGKKKQVRIVVCTEEELEEALIEDHHCLLILFRDPLTEGEGVMPDATVSARDIAGGALHVLPSAAASGPDLREVIAGAAEPDAPPPHGLKQLVDRPVVIRFADLDPAELQDRWDQPVEPFGKLPKDLIMTAAEGKQLWAAVTKKRQDNWEVLLLADGGDRRALSVALGVTDMLYLDRAATIYQPSAPDNSYNKETKPPNQFVYDFVKNCRGMVVG